MTKLRHTDVHSTSDRHRFRVICEAIIFLVGSISNLAFRRVRKFQKVTLSFVVSARLSVRHQSVRTEHISCHRTDCPEILYLSIFRKSIEKIQILLESNKNN